MNTVPTYRQGRRVYTPGRKRITSCDKFLSYFLTTLFILIPPILVYLNEKHRFETFTSLNEAINSNIIELHPSRKHSIEPGAVVHGSSSNIKSSTRDRGMNIDVDNSLTLTRQTEYCQWEEIRSETCDTCSSSSSDGNEMTETYECNCVTTFNYFKTWREYLINSFLFDQPAAHHNPQRDPLPRSTFLSKDIMMEFGEHEYFLQPHQDQSYNKAASTLKAQLSSSMVQNGIRGSKSRVIKWVHRGIPPIPPFWAFWAKWIPDRSRYENSRDIIKHSFPFNFVYVGDGYFFSPYTASRYESSFKYFIKYVEGSLFDWQIGDLMPSCEAGDIRIRYTVQDPTDVSILGQVTNVDNLSSTSSTVAVEPFQSKIGKAVGLVHQGYHSAEEMIKSEDHDSFVKACILRVLLILWSEAVCHIIGSKIFHFNVSGAKVPTQFAMIVAVWCFCVGCMWTIIWGMNVDGIFLLFTSLVFSAIVVLHPPPLKKKKLLNW